MTRLFIILFLFAGFQASAQHLFIGSYNSDSTKEGIYVYRFDPETGDLKRETSYKGILNPTFLIVDGKRIYACTEAKTKGMGSVSSFVVDGEIKLTGKQDSGGENPVYVTRYQNWIVAANYNGGSVSALPIDAQGIIRPAAQVITFKDSSITDRQTSSHIHSANFSPDHNYVFLPDLGADKIRCYRFDARAKQPLTVHGITRTVPGSGPRHMAFHPNGKYVYCVEEMAGYISAYKYHDGQLDSLQRIAAHSKSYEVYGGADIHFSPDGLFLYASNRGKENNIVIYSVGSNGKLELVGYQDTGGNHPRNFTIDPAGNFLLVANQVSGDVIVFKRNKKTGKLSRTTTKILVREPSCLVIQ